MKNPTFHPPAAVQCHIDLGQVPAIGANYLANAPLPVLAHYGTAPLHAYILRREDWDHARIFAEKDRSILRSDCWESVRGNDWRDIVIDEGGGVFFHIEAGRLSAFGPDHTTARNAANSFRSEYARPRSAAKGCYHLITVSSEHISTEVVEISASAEPCDLELNYGRGFSAWTSDFLETLGSKSSGLTLFEGPPGTGKTSFLRNLICRLKESHRFYFIPPANTGVLTNPEFIGFWSQQHAAYPDMRFVCVIEDAEEALMVRENDNRRQAAAILNITDGLLADFLRLHVICSINCKSTEIDPAFLRPGRLIAHRNFPRLDAATAQRIAEKAGRLLPLQNDYSLAEIFNTNPLKERLNPRIGFAA